MGIDRFPGVLFPKHILATNGVYSWGARTESRTKILDVCNGKSVSFRNGTRLNVIYNTYPRIGISAPPTRAIWMVYPHKPLFHQPDRKLLRQAKHSSLISVVEDPTPDGNYSASSVEEFPDFAS